MGIEIISELLPKNNAKFALMDVNNLRGGYIQVNTILEMNEFLKYKDRLKEGMFYELFLYARNGAGVFTNIPSFLNILFWISRKLLQRSYHKLAGSTMVSSSYLVIIIDYLFYL